jgi:SAM-dependent methyltransferase
MSERSSEGLEQVYAARTREELASAYSVWSNGYDAETAAGGYALPFLITSWVARHVPCDVGPILDAGCGTGLSGPYLRALGYQAIEGLDMSEEMLGLAAGRGVYRDLKRGVLGDALPWADDHFAAFLCTGVFTEGHAPASSLDELVRVTRSGGRAVFTVRDLVLDDFRATFARIEQAGCWRLLEESPFFRAFAVAEPDVLVKAFVFDIL